MLPAEKDSNVIRDNCRLFSVNKKKLTRVFRIVVLNPLGKARRVNGKRTLSIISYVEFFSHDAREN